MSHKGMFKCATALGNFALLVLLISCTDKDMSVPAVITHEADSVTNTSAVITGVASTSDGAMIVASGTFWDTTQNLTLTLPTKSVSFNSGGEIYYKVEGLAANTEYFARCYASSDWGVGYGNIIRFTTLNQTPDVGFAYSDDTDYFIVNNDKCNLGTAYLLWGPDYPNPWRISFRAWPSSPEYIRHFDFSIYFSGLKPPMRSGTFDVQQDLENLDGSHVYVTYNYFNGFNFSSISFSSLSGQVKVELVNGQVSMTFDDIEVQDSTGSFTYHLSGHFTCH